jgi:hypothetical protein
LDLRGRKWREAGEHCIMRSFITCMLHINIIRVIKSKKTRGAVHVERMGEIINLHNLLVGKSGAKKTLGRLHVDRMIMLERILGKWVGCGLDISGSV